MDCCPEWRDQQQHPDPALPLFAPDEPSSKKPRTASTSRMGSLFSLSQWQELELQALIYKCIMSGASVPLELILPLKRSLVCSSPYYHYHHHFQPSMIQTGYWGRCEVDPEPGRCRRTDGKKWRCAREVVAGQKYCERHVHRGQNRSRKHVEIHTPTATATATAGSSGFKATPHLFALQEENETRFTLSGPSPNHRPAFLDGKVSDGCLAQRYCPKFCCTQQLQSERTDSRVLMRFFDDWPKSEKESTTSNNNAGSVVSAAELSSSVPVNSSSDFSLKLSTGNNDNPGLSSKRGYGDGQVQAVLSNWSGWENHGEASMGGPLAEALRSSTSTTSPTSILRNPNGSVSETSSASTGITGPFISF